MLKTFIRRMFAPYARRMTRSVAPILTYHRFGTVFRALPTEVFEDQLLYLKRHYHVTTLEDIAARVVNGEPFVPNSVALTVDDGHRDFLEDAYPLLQKHRVPVTLFMVVDAMLNSWLWFDQLHYLMRAAPAGEYQMLVGKASRKFMLGDVRSRDDAWEALADHCLELGDGARDEFIREVEQVFQISRPEIVPHDYAYLTSSELAGLDPELVEVGSHTLSHPILSKCSYAQQKREISVSLTKLQEKLGRRVKSFAYPNGRLCDIDTSSVKLAREAGYSTAVVCDGGFVRQGADPHMLSRIGAAYNMAGLRRQLDGVSYVSHRMQRRQPLQIGSH